MHKSKRVQRLIEQTRATLAVPPRAALLRGLEPHRRRGLLEGEGRPEEGTVASTRESVVEATGRALGTLTRKDIRGLYGDCGYPLVVQSL